MAQTLPAKDNRFFKSATKLLTNTRTDSQLFHAIVNAPFNDRVTATKLGLGIVVLLLANKRTGTIDRIALSDTELAKGAVKMSEVPFHEIKIPIGHRRNIIAKAIDTGTPQTTADWQFLFTPALSPKSARFNQAGSGIECSVVYPLENCRSGGALIFSYYVPRGDIGPQHHDFMKTYAALAADALRSQ